MLLFLLALSTAFFLITLILVLIHRRFGALRVLLILEYHSKLNLILILINILDNLLYIPRVISYLLTQSQ